MESQKLKTQKLKCYVLVPKSQKFPTAENTRYTVYSLNLEAISILQIFYFNSIILVSEASQKKWS